VEHLLIKYGYFVLFLGVAVEGEGFLLASSFMAHRGYLHLPLVMLVALAANCAADQIYYLMARARGRAWLEGRFGKHPRYQHTVSLISRHANRLLLFSRFAVGFRIIIPAACGALGMLPMRFSIINLFAGLIWTVPTALLGFYFGQLAEPALASAQHYEWTLLLLFLLAVVAILVARHLRRAQWVEDLRLADLHRLVPLLIGLMGIINLISAILPRSRGTFHAMHAWRRSRSPSAAVHSC